jgi:hypothetical protein
MSPEVMKDMASNPQVMKAMMNPKFQDMMKETMTKGPEAVAKMVEEDPELMELINELGKVLPPMNG